MKKILVVDDQKEIRELVEITLRMGDYQIFQAGTGPEAIEIARREKPNLMFLDVMMPEGGMDGFDVCTELKNDPETAGITIIMLTALGQDEDRERGNAAGADDYFTKPFSPLKLMQKTDEILS